MAMCIHLLFSTERAVGGYNTRTRVTHTFTMHIPSCLQSLRSCRNSMAVTANLNEFQYELGTNGFVNIIKECFYLLIFS